ncbi:MAG: hypothetical protein AAF355_07465 [Myxococcota bacterium]
MSADRFTDWVGEAIVSLPQQMKAMLRVVDDPEVADQGRVFAAGALLHVLVASNAIPGMRGILAYVDDVLVIKLVLERLCVSDAEAMSAHRESSPELFSGLEDHMESAREYLGELLTLVDKAVDDLPKLQHQGHTPGQCVHDTDGGNWLYDIVHEAIVEQFEFDEDEVYREIKRIDQIRTSLRSRVTTPK